MVVFACCLLCCCFFVVLKMRNEETGSDRGRDLSPRFSHILAAKKIEVMRPDRLVTRGNHNCLQKNEAKMEGQGQEPWPPNNAVGSK